MIKAWEFTSFQIDKASLEEGCIKFLEKPNTVARSHRLDYIHSADSVISGERALMIQISIDTCTWDS